MVKRYKTILSVLLVVLIATGAVLVTGVIDINKTVARKEVEQNPGLAATYKDIFMTVADMNVPILATDIEDVYYSMDKSGEVSFYLLKDGSLTEIPETGNFEISAKMSGQTLPAVIHYLEYGEKTTGFGLFTNELYDNVYIYDYAFFKLSDFFPDYSVSAGTLLLMADTDKTRFYSEDKVYSEIFKLSSDRSLSYFLNENQRTVDLNAKMRTDYKMFTNDTDSQRGSKLFFFSSRFYTAYDEYTATDIMSTGGSGENVDNIRYVTDVLSLNFWRTDEGIYYFLAGDEENRSPAEETEEGAVSGEYFRLCFFDGKNEKEIGTFDGNLAEDYIIDGDFILNCTTGEIYNILEGTALEISYENMAKSFRPDMFEISANGKYCVVRGANNRNHPAVILCDFESGEQVDYTDDIFGFVSNINIASDGTVAISVATDSTAVSYYQIVSGSRSSAAGNEEIPGETEENESEA